LVLLGAEKAGHRKQEARPAAEHAGPGLASRILNWFKKEFF